MYTAQMIATEEQAPYCEPELSRQIDEQIAMQEQVDCTILAQVAMILGLGLPGTENHFFTA